ncbi:hypothetical protein M3Y97_00298600 [Aphelenchoides bicaudatus]|nr:hypothetical protein M3Y97_00298600 [Aphelenchoides bicaudatus]
MLVGFVLFLSLDAIDAASTKNARKDVKRKDVQICPNGWQLSNFGCNWDQHCQINGQNGVCRQQRCCVPGNTQLQNCLTNERNTGQQCWNSNQCSFGSIWSASTCRNGYCCEQTNLSINQPTPACEQGTAVAEQCTHDSQCWIQSSQPNQLGICQNGHCCILTCQNGGRPVGRQCSRNAQDCVYLRGNQYLFGVCDQNICCSRPDNQQNGWNSVNSTTKNIQFRKDVFWQKPHVWSR